MSGDITTVDNPRDLAPEGEISLLDVTRLVRENAPRIAPNLLRAYQNFDKLPKNYEASFIQRSPELDQLKKDSGWVDDILIYEDRANGIWVEDGSKVRYIRVFLTPPDTQITGESPKKQFPAVQFRYTKDLDGNIKYENAIINHPRAGWIKTTSDLREEKRRDSGFVKVKINKEDLERALNRYLDPNSQLTIPPEESPTQRFTGLRRLLGLK